MLIVSVICKDVKIKFTCQRAIECQHGQLLVWNEHMIKLFECS